MENNATNQEARPAANEDMRDEALSVWQSIRKFLSELLDIRQDTDREATVEAVRADIPFKGHVAWILIFSVFVASIGLNVSSAAVVIGAMLISPLMGPIVGIGLSTAINDGTMMKRSFVNLGVMVVLSVLTAFIYFRISPLTELTPELESRTAPNILDVLVAIFGGLALIVAKTKKGTMASVIFGVAIATALMPPLCTVGYGLAVGNMSFAGGAMFLFSINAVFIALATFVVAKLLRFPLVKYANQKKRKRTAAIAGMVALLVIVPSIYFFIKLYQREVFDNEVKNFVNNTMKYDGAEVIKFTQDYDQKEVNVYLIGSLIPQNRITAWNNKLKDVEGMGACELIVHQGADQSNALAEKLSSEVKSGILEELYVDNRELLTSKDAQIQLLEDQLSQLKSSAIRFESIVDEVKIVYSDLQRFGYASEVSSDFSTSDTLSVFRVQWSEDLSEDTMLEKEQKLNEWMKQRFKLDTLVVQRY